MIDLATLLWWTLALVVGGSCIFLISENRNPQATLAWMLAFIAAPGLGLLLYILFGRDYYKAFSRQRKLLTQEIEGRETPVLQSLLERQDAALVEREAHSANQRKLITLVRRNSHSILTLRNDVAILQDAAEFYPRLMQDIGAARHSVHLQYYSWAADEFTESLKTLLAERVKSGVEVRLLYDLQGSHASLTRRYVREMHAAGIQMVPTSRLRLHTASYRNHRKLTVVDGIIGYAGGMNIGQEHLDGGKGFDSWRDTQVRIVGEGAAALQAVFAVDWYNAVGEYPFDARHFPHAATHAAHGEVAIQILTSGPDSRWAAIRQLYFAMIVGARRLVRIQSPYFILDASIVEALRSAALAGTDVKVMLSARASGDRVPGWAGNTYMVEAVSAGVRVFLYQKGYLHAKTISVDGAVCSIGSANIDIRSFSLNYELNAVLYDARLAGELEARFEQDLLECIEFDPDEYMRRNKLARFRDSVARLFSPLM